MGRDGAAAAAAVARGDIERDINCVISGAKRAPRRSARADRLFGIGIRIGISEGRLRRREGADADGRPAGGRTLNCSGRFC